MKTRSWSSLGCLTAAVLLAGTSLRASAGTLFNVNFNQDTVGQAPSAARPQAGVVSTKPTHLRLNRKANVVVQAGYTDPVTKKTLGGPHDKVAVMADTSKKADTQIVFQAAKADRVSKGEVTIEFDMLMAKLKQGSGNLILTAKTSPHTTPKVGPGPYPIAAAIINYQGSTELVAFDRTKHQSGVTQAKQLTPRGAVVHVKYMLDFDKATQTLTVGDLPPIEAPMATDSNFGRLGLYSTTPAIGTTAFDNITITATDEGK